MASGREQTQQCLKLEKLDSVCTHLLAGSPSEGSNPWIPWAQEALGTSRLSCLSGIYKHTNTNTVETIWLSLAKESLVILLFSKC